MSNRSAVYFSMYAIILSITSIIVSLRPVGSVGEQSILCTSCAHSSSLSSLSNLSTFYSLGDSLSVVGDSLSVFSTPTTSIGNI